MTVLRRKRTFGIIAVVTAIYLAPVLLADGPLIWGIILLVPVIVAVTLLIGIFITLAVPAAALMPGLLTLTRTGPSRTKKAIVSAPLFAIGLSALVAYSILIGYGVEAVPLLWWLRLNPDIQIPITIAVTVTSSLAGIYLRIKSKRARRSGDWRPRHEIGSGPNGTA